MSYYYQYKFVSPDAIWANVKEELKSYFDTGAVDDLMFPVWTEKCLRKLGRSSYKIRHAVLNICHYEAKLMPDFYAVREAWMTSSVMPITYQKPGSYYNEITTQLNPDYNQSSGFVQDNLPDPNDQCNPEMVSLVYKTTTQTTQSIRLTYLLKPGNISCRREHCGMGAYDGYDNKLDVECLNYNSSAYDSFDIRDNKFVTNFKEGDVYLVYYAEERNEEGYQLIPDNYRIQEFIEAFLKQKIFEQLYNQVVDETFNQIEKKLQMYTKNADEAFIMAFIEVKKEDPYKKFRAIHRDRTRYNDYKLDGWRDKWRRYKW